MILVHLIFNPPYSYWLVYFGKNLPGKNCFSWFFGKIVLYPPFKKIKSGPEPLSNILLERAFCNLQKYALKKNYLYKKQFIFVEGLL